MIQSQPFAEFPRLIFQAIKIRLAMHDFVIRKYVFVCRRSSSEKVHQESVNQRIEDAGQFRLSHLESILPDFE